MYFYPLRNASATAVALLPVRQPWSAQDGPGHQGTDATQSVPAHGLAGPPRRLPHCGEPAEGGSAMLGPAPPKPAPGPRRATLAPCSGPRPLTRTLGILWPGPVGVAEHGPAEVSQPQADLIRQLHAQASAGERRPQFPRQPGGAAPPPAHAHAQPRGCPGRRGCAGGGFLPSASVGCRTAWSLNLF